MMVRTERCVCTGWIEPETDDDHAIAKAIDSHALTNLHTAWRYQMLMNGTLTMPETPAEQIRRHLAPKVEFRRVEGVRLDRADVPPDQLTDPELIPPRRRREEW